jgi:hypothetical protein
MMPLSDRPNFHHLVRLLRTWPKETQIMALYAAQCWSDERLAKAEANDEWPGESAMVLKLVKPNDGE